MNSKSVRMQLDTGRDIAMIDEKTWKAIGKHYLDLTWKVTQSVCGNKLIFRGQITVNVSVNGKLGKAKACFKKLYSQLIWIRLDRIVRLELEVVQITPRG